MKERIGTPNRSESGRRIGAKEREGERDGFYSFTISRRFGLPIHSLIILLGANLGDRLTTLRRAAELIAERVGPIMQQSSLYETAPWGVTDQPTFLNQVVEVETKLEANTVLIKTQEIENELGRIRHEKWGARMIDIDILYYNQLILQTPTLTIPHPYLHLRRFTLAPLAEIVPDFRHPILQKTTRELLADCLDESAITIFNA